jgi:predicted DNA-binding protein YlxM (UPF0122 family)
MSADNAIYTRPLKNGKYVVKCISSLYPDDLSDAEIDEAFEGSTEFDTIEDSDKEVDRIYDEYEKSGHIIEYGHEILHRDTVVKKFLAGTNFVSDDNTL